MPVILRPMSLRAAMTTVMLAARLPLGGCGGGGGDKPEPAGGKVLRIAAVQRCLKKQRLLVARKGAQNGIDFTAYWRDGHNQADFGLERGPEEAAAREDGWKQLAEQAHIRDVD